MPRPGAQHPELEPHGLDPVALLKGLVSLRRLTGLYPAGHPAIEQKLTELDDTVQRHIRASAALRIGTVIHGSAHLDGIPFRQDSDMQAQMLRELTDLGIDSIHFGPGVSRAELLALWSSSGSSRKRRAASRLTCSSRHGRFGTSRSAAWFPSTRGGRPCSGPTRRAAPSTRSYELSLALTERTFDDVMSGKGVDLATIRDIVHLWFRRSPRATPRSARFSPSNSTRT